MWKRANSGSGGSGGLVGAVHIRYYSPSYYFSSVTANGTASVYTTVAATAATGTIGAETDFVKIEKIAGNHNFRVTYLDDCSWANTSGITAKTKNTYTDYTQFYNQCADGTATIIFK